MINGNLFREVTVLAFRAVYTLERKRRENDKRVLAIYAEYVAPNFVPSSPPHEPQDERHDNSSPPVGFITPPQHRHP